MNLIKTDSYHKSTMFNSKSSLYQISIILFVVYSMQQDQMITLPQSLTSVVFQNQQLQQNKTQFPLEIEPPVKNTHPNFQRYWNIIKQKLADRKQTELNIHRYKQLLIESQTNKQLDRALGAVYGAMIGDALGAYCQFCQTLTDKVVDQAMKMPGGGTFGLQAGQFTDDSQMATHLLKGLQNLKINQPLEKQHYQLISSIGLEYINWYQTNPFDIGNTCRTAISILKEEYQVSLKHSAKKGDQEPGYFKEMYKYIKNNNNQSQANGSLMRISPLALFFSMSNKNPLQYSQFIKDQVRLTHPNSLLGDAGLFWVNVLTMLINRKGDEKEQFEQILNKNIKDSRFEKLTDWIEQASTQIRESMHANKCMGYAKIAFSYGLKALYYIVQGKETQLDGTFYTNWIKWIIKRAGDTDTNAAIAGGLLGSIIGFWNLPTDYVVTSLKTVTDKRQLVIQGHKEQIAKKKHDNPERPNFYEPANALFLTLDVVQKCRLFSQNEDK